MTPLATVNKARRAKLPVHEKRQRVFQIVLDHMNDVGEFYRTRLASWWVEAGVGQPILLMRRSFTLEVYLDVTFGINPMEPESDYMCGSIEGYALKLPVTAKQQALSYYDEPDRTFYLHTGKGSVVSVTDARIAITENAANNLLFPWPHTGDDFTPALKGKLAKGKRWFDYLFNVDTVISPLTPQTAKAVLASWFMFLLFRSASMSRPILAFTGEPGSGKTVSFQCIYVLLYGETKYISSPSSSDNFDYACHSDPLVVMDNADGTQYWLPNALATAAARKDVTKRKLYSNDQVVTLCLDAMVGLTTHNPEGWQRVDVSDRMLIVPMERYAKFSDVTPIVQAVLTNRAVLWGAILKDIQTALNTHYPLPDEAPQIRVQDFGTRGLWFARALGLEAEFMQGIQLMVKGQKQFALEDETNLIDAIDRALISPGYKALWLRPVHLYDMLKMHAKNPDLFEGRFKNAGPLSRKLLALYANLKSFYDIEWRPTPTGREWRIGPKKP